MSSTLGKPIRNAELIFCGQLFAASMIMFSAFRLLFLWVYSSEFIEIPAMEILRGFLHGLRFDAAVASWGVVPVLLLSHLPYVNRAAWFRHIWIALAHVILVVFFLLTFSDLLYFEHAHKRLGYEAFAYLDTSILPIAVTAIVDGPFRFILGIACLVGLYLLSRHNVKRLGLTRHQPLRLRNRLVIALVCIPLVVVLARGGLQRVPLRVADSFISRHNNVNLLTINSSHMAFRSIGKGRPVRLMDSGRSQRISLKLLELEGTLRPLADYPLVVMRHSDNTVRQLNVVVILMESMTAKYTAAGGDTLGVTPCLNKLAREGLLFDRFIATGFRSTSGLFSVLTGIPDQPGIPVMRRPELQDNFGSLSILLKDRGYKNIFVHGGLLDFDNLENMLRHELFDLIIGKKQMSDCGGPERTWGYDDEFIFQRAHREFVNCGNQPFFGFIFSVSTHAPYLLPDDKHIKFLERDHEEYRFLNSLYYSDWALGRFMELASKETYFDNTVFVVTGDHTHHFRLNLFENQHLPLLIYAPGLVQPGTRSTIASHTDILPTVASLLQLPYHAAMGRNLLDLPEQDGFAFWITGQGIGWVEDSCIAVMGLDDNPPIIYDFETADFTINLAELDTALGRALREKADAFYQFSSDLLKDNRIFPNRGTGDLFAEP